MSIGKRSGGRAGRRNRKAAEVMGEVKAMSVVRGGLEGGTMRPLTDAEMDKIHNAALDVLEKVGFAEVPDYLVDLFRKAGATISEEGRVCLPRGMVEDHIANCNRGWVLHGRNGAEGVEFSGRKVSFTLGGAAVSTLKPDHSGFRDSTLNDLYESARIADSLENIHLVHRPLIARDIADTTELDISTAYAMIRGTNKPLSLSMADPASAEKIGQLLDYVAGGDGEFRKKPFALFGNAFIVPPLRLAAETCEITEATVRLGIPYLFSAVGQAGATAPASLTGSLVQSLAESLFGLVYVNLISPGHPVLLGIWPFVSDLRTGAFSGGGGEQAILMAAAAQIASRYGIPNVVTAGMSDSKVPDVQAGYEKGYTLATAALAGPNLIFTYAGILASLLGYSHEQLVIDNELLGHVLRMLRGIEVSDEALSVDVIREAALGPGHFLASEQTLSLMNTEFLYPKLGDRKSPDDWVKSGHPTALTRARTQVQDILANHWPNTLSPEQVVHIEATFGVRKLD